MHPEPRRGSPVAWLTGYYLATPLFALADAALSFSVRAAAIQSAPLRFAYYALLLGLGLLGRARPRMASWIGMLESAFSLTLLLLAVLLPIWGAEPDALPSPESITERTINLALSGTVLVVAFYQHQARAMRR